VKYSSHAFVCYVVVDDFLYSYPQYVSDGSVPEYVELVNVGLAECPGFAAPEEEVGWYG